MLVWRGTTRDTSTPPHGGGPDTGSDSFRMSGKRTTLFLAVTLLLAVGGSVARAEATSREYQLKAAFLYNFAQFVEWPDDSFKSSGSPIVIAVLGQNPFGTALEQIVGGKSVNGRSIAIRYFATIEEMESCHILFVCPSERFNVGPIVAKAGPTTLTVGDFEGFTRDGGIFRLFAESNKMRFEVNMDAARRSRLKISSKLLKLAKVYGRQ